MSPVAVGGQANAVRAVATLLLALSAACAAAQAPTPPAKPSAAIAATAPKAAPPATRPAVASTPATAPSPAVPVVPEVPSTQPVIPPAQLIWSLALDKDAPSLPQTDPEFRSLRSVAIVADRAEAVYLVQAEISRGGRPVNTWRLVSIDLKTGLPKVQKKIQSLNAPQLYATDDDHLIVGRASLTRLNPDLTETGEKFSAADATGVALLSPDGSTLAVRGPSEVRFLDARTLAPTGDSITTAEPAAISRRVLLTDDGRWAGEFPKDVAFVTLMDERRSHLLYHGECGGRPAFLTEEKILVIACGKATILGNTGRLLKEIKLNQPFARFAGAALDGSKFAIATSDYPLDDPATATTELFTIYNSSTYEAVATVQQDSSPDNYPWSAFSRDGAQFISGGPQKLSLYKLP